MFLDVMIFESSLLVTEMSNRQYVHSIEVVAEINLIMHLNVTLCILSV